MEVQAVQVIIPDEEDMVEEQLEVLEDQQMGDVQVEMEDHKLQEVQAEQEHKLVVVQEVLGMVEHLVIVRKILLLVVLVVEAGMEAGGGGNGGPGGGGGSGYVYTSSTASQYPSGCLLNSSYYLTNASTTGNSRSGNGYATITLIE